MTKVIGYSERGYVYSLVSDVQSRGEDFVQVLFRLAGFKIKGKIENVTIYVEPSLSEFGNPDLIIHFKDKNVAKICFVEAKNKVKISDEWKKFDKNIDIENNSPRKNFTSNLFSQLSLKVLYTKAKKIKDVKKSKNNVEFVWDDFSQCKGLKGSKNKRSIGVKEVVWDLVRKSNWRKGNDYYVGIVNNTKGVEKEYLKRFPLKEVKNRVALIEWKDIAEELKKEKFEMQMFLNTKKFNKWKKTGKI